MIAWTPFYRMLGIPDDVVEPTLYQLLGLSDPRSLSPEMIDLSLQERRRQLRQGIPGPQFIPMMSRFEAELEQAADLLRDPRRREEYNRRLIERARLHRRTVQERTERQELVQRARKVIRKALNAKGALPGTRREELAGQLRELGVPDADVAEVLARIPTERKTEERLDEDREAFFITSVDLAIQKGVLTPADEVHLHELAGKFNLLESRAREIIGQRLTQAGAVRAQRDPDQVEAELLERLRTQCANRASMRRQRKFWLAYACAQGLPILVAERVIDAYASTLPDQSAFNDWESLEVAIDEDDSPVETEEAPGRSGHDAHRSWLSPRLIRTGVPLLAVFVFIVFAVLLLDRRQPRHVAVADWSPPPHDIQPSPPPADPVANRSVRLPRDTDRPGRSQESHPRIHQDAPNDVTPSRRDPDDREKEGEDFRSCFARDGSPEGKLADLVLILVASAVQVEQFTGIDHGWSFTMRTLLQSQDRVASLTRQVDTGLSALPSPGLDSAAGRLISLQKALSSSDRAERYRAIDELRSLGSPDAVTALLAAYIDRTTSDASFCYRVLRAVSRMDDPSIPQRVIPLIAVSPPRCAYLISEMLSEHTGVTPPQDRKLPLLHKPEERYECAAWWARRFQAGDVHWQSGQKVPTVETHQILFRPDRLPVRLATTAAYCCERTATMLAGETEPDPEQADDRAPPGFSPIYSDAYPEQHLANAMERVIHELARLARQAAGTPDEAVRVDIAELHLQARSLACDTGLQRVVVRLDVIGELLEILIDRRFGDPGTALAVERIRNDRRKAVSDAQTVLEQMRESAYHNLALWSILSEAQR